MTTTFSVLLTNEVPADDCPVDHPDHHGEWSYSSSTQLGESREFMEVDNRILKLSYHFLSHFPLIPTLSEHGLQIGNFRYFQHWNHLKSFVQFAEPIWNPKFGCPRSTHLPGVLQVKTVFPHFVRLKFSSHRQRLIDTHSPPEVAASESLVPEACV